MDRNDHFHIIHKRQNCNELYVRTVIKGVGFSCFAKFI